MPLLINWFKVDLSPFSFTLPTKDFPSWEDSTAVHDGDSLKPFRTYRGRTGAESISIVLLHGPPAPLDWENRTYTTRTHRNVVADIIKRALEEHFKLGELVTSRSKWGVTATRPVSLMANDAIQLSNGVSCQVYSPDLESGMGVTAQWEVKAEFVKSLAEEQLRSVCLDLPVKLCYNPQVWQPEEKLRSFHNHYFGVVKSVVSDDKIEVLARDNQLYEVPADKLFLEAKPSAIKEYENRNVNVQAGHSVWRRIQELNHVLTTGGRRNTSVMQDRLNSIRKFLSPQGNDLLVMELPIYGGGQASLDLRPATVQTEIV